MEPRTARRQPERLVRSELRKVPAPARPRGAAAKTTVTAAAKRGGAVTMAAVPSPTLAVKWLEAADGAAARARFYDEASNVTKALLISPSLLTLLRDEARLSAAGKATAVLALEGGQVDKRELAKLSRPGSLVVLATSDALAHPEVQSNLEKLRLGAAAIDEAQLLSTEGQQLRPSFLALPELVRRLRPTRLSLLARPCRAELRRDIERSFASPVQQSGEDLLARDVVIECRAVRGERRTPALIEAIKSLSGHGVVLCASPHEVDANFAALTAAGVAVCRAHAGMPDADRDAALARFAADTQGLTLLTTSAVGPDSGLLGIGETRASRPVLGFGRATLRPDLRFVVHFHAPASLEQYAQEICWVGDDGLGGTAILFYDSAQRSLNESVLEQQRYAPKQLAPLLHLLGEATPGGKPLTVESLALQSGQSRRTTERLVALLIDAALAERNGNVVSPRVGSVELVSAGDRLAEQLATLRAGDAARLSEVERFAEAKGCRREWVLRHFGRDAKACGQCSTCVQPSGSAGQKAGIRPKAI